MRRQRRYDGAVRRPFHLAALLFCAAAAASPRPGITADPATPRERVVLLHGLGRTSRSMLYLAGRLEREGFETTRVDYPSTSASLSDLAAAIEPAFRPRRPGERVHAVTHSMGGLLLRWHARRCGAGHLGRVVMLAPPNAGSELADELARFEIYRRIVGPAGLQLGTDPTRHRPASAPSSSNLASSQDRRHLTRSSPG